MLVMRDSSLVRSPLFVKSQSVSSAGHSVPSSRLTQGIEQRSPRAVHRNSKNQGLHARGKGQMGRNSLCPDCSSTKLPSISVTHGKLESSLINGVLTLIMFAFPQEVLLFLFSYEKLSISYQFENQ